MSSVRHAARDGAAKTVDDIAMMMITNARSIFIFSTFGSSGETFGSSGEKSFAATSA
jgi:hypothetical protein